MGQLHYMLTESVISIPCQICSWTSVGPFCEGIEELYSQMSVVWCISVHAYLLFCIHVACRVWQWQFSFWGWGSVEGCAGAQYSNAGAHGAIKEEASSCNGQFSRQKNVGKSVRVWQGLRHGKGGFSCLADVNFFMWLKGVFFLVQKGVFFSTKRGFFLVQNGGFSSKVSTLQNRGFFST